MITRYFIDVETNGNKRRVHYRLAGSGPPLLMVHQSPRSSKEYEALMQKWAKHFTCIAPDTPGFGQSDPLPGKPEINEYADALIEFLDALGVKKCAAYGFHSGGIILVTAVKRHANHFTTLAIGGYAIWTPEEMQLFSEKYLPEFHPSDYGEHLTWLWNRILEQSWFFPWFATDNEHRLSVAHGDPQRVDAVVREMLDAGNAYQAGYGAVLRAPRDIPAVDADVPPCLISAYDGDPLQDHIDRLGAMPSSWSAMKVATPEDHQAASLQHLLTAETGLTEELHQAPDEGFLAIEVENFKGLIHWRGKKTSSKLVIHAPGRALSKDGASNGVHIDLAGHGLSDDWLGNPPTDWHSWSKLIDACAEQLGIENIIYDPLPSGDAALLYPDLLPDRFGCYLTKAWQAVRAMQMFEPWYEATAAHAVPVDPGSLRPEILAERHLELLNARAAREYHLASLTKSPIKPRNI
ncbi:alpha/beta fold hydrolase [uncultured Parasphingorhabdus sp.]|uniref:alpha/beta hydrolase n=1 Tax=uncultured Parasphingorhabdus sp. TaxID=2709694 RepID=UPI0030DA9637|tara:strand:+ start:42436 stop:43827 length:1392 start_codon:yes stop_codon:yes gene_type:complete